MRKLLLTLIMTGAWWYWNKHREEIENPTPIRGKVVIITGASAGIGRATATAFAAAGAHVVLVARRADVLAEAEESLTRFEGETLAVTADISLEKDLSAIVDAAMKRFGQIDVLINNAGISMGGPLDEYSSKDIRQLIGVNLTGLIRLTQLVLPGMLERRSGHIINVSSIASFANAPGTSVYAASKNAVNAFSDALGREVEDRGVLVSTVYPGWVRTAMIGQLDQAAMHESGILNELVTIEEPETIARILVDTVRYRRRRVVSGGPLFLATALVTLGIPTALDYAFRNFFDRRKVVNIMRNSGA